VRLLHPERVRAGLAPAAHAAPVVVRGLPHSVRRGATLERLDDWDAIREWFDAIIEVQERLEFIGGCPIGRLAADRTEADAALRPRLLQALRMKGEYLRSGLERMKAEGRLREDADPARLVVFVTAVLQGALLLASVQKEREPLEAALDEAYRHLRSFAVSVSILTSTTNQS
jgi:TetR/AcrR family transcriptional regulator, transcriptional repressor for nem operon